MFFLSQTNNKVACFKLFPVGLNLLFSSLPLFPLARQTFDIILLLQTTINAMDLMIYCGGNYLYLFLSKKNYCTPAKCIFLSYKIKHELIRFINSRYFAKYFFPVHLGNMSTVLRANLTRVTSPPNSTPRRFPSYFLCTLLLFHFHLLPSPVHPTGFSFHIFPCVLAIFVLDVIEQQQQHLSV